MELPKDPIMLLSFINMRLRDGYSSLNELCKACVFDEEYIIDTLSQIDYHYDAEQNAFV